jgi:hypothetical protein
MGINPKSPRLLLAGFFLARPIRLQFRWQRRSHGGSDPKNDFNLNLPRYIDSTDLEDLQDIDDHLRVGIPERDIDALERYWQVIPSRGPLARRHC